jgi:large subunit ribosomal protein L1
MPRLSKRTKAIRAKVDSRKLYAVEAALALVKECAGGILEECIVV